MVQVDPGTSSQFSAAGTPAVGGLVIPASSRRRRPAAAVTAPELSPSSDLLARLWETASQAGEDAIFGLDAAGRIIGWNPAATRLFGYPESEVTGRLAGLLFVGRGAEHGDPARALLAGSRAGRAVSEARRRDGTTVAVTITTAPLSGGGGLCVVVRDRAEMDDTERQRDEAVESLARQNSLWDLLRRITNIANEAFDLTDALHQCMLEIFDRFDWPFGHAITFGPTGTVESNLWYLADRERYGPLQRLMEAGESGLGLAEHVVQSRQAIWLTSLPSPEAPDAAAGALLAAVAGLRSGFAFPVSLDGEVVAVVEMLGPQHSTRDSQMIACVRHGSVQLGRVVERERSRDRLNHQAMHDSLTALPNRSLLMDRLARAVRSLREGGPQLAVLFVDLDDFKVINDSLGHDVGDQVLKTVAGRLLEVMGPGDTAARFGGDEFVIVSESLVNSEAVGDVANRVLEALAEPIRLDGRSSTVVTGSIGVAIAAGPDAVPEHLVRDADAAMYRAKDHGRGRFNIFDTALHDRASLKLSIGSELRQAVANQEIRLEYQPQFRISDGRLIGVEALARWDHPDRGTLGPADWIPVAEENQLIVPIGGWIIDEACRMAAEWIQMAGPDDFKVCVNVSAVQLARPELIDGVIAALRASGVDPACLCMEVTESILMAAPGTYLEALLGLKLLGLSIAVDDFGTGYSSLAYLRRFPIDVIKVDKGFVDGLGTADHRAPAILRAVIQLSEALGVASVAEGVETADQARILAESGCFGAQGFFFGRPGGPEEITRRLRAQP